MIQPTPQPPDVDLIVNVYERTYRAVLEPGFFLEIEQRNQRSFAERIVLVNNVVDGSDFERRAAPLIQSGELTRVVTVSDHLADAIHTTRWRMKDFGRAQHYSDWALVAVTLSGSRWLVCWDAEVSLRGTRNWIDPALTLLQSRPDVLVANPDWGGALAEGLEQAGDFTLGYGFSDQLFLVDRTRLAAPIYHYFCPASWRYPMTHLGLIFEARVDAYMRRRRLQRATFHGARYDHPTTPGDYPPLRTLGERLKRWRNRWTLRLLRKGLLPGPVWRI